MSRRDYYHPPRFDGDSDEERERKNDDWQKYSQEISDARAADSTNPASSSQQAPDAGSDDD